MKLIIQIPCHNEEQTLPLTLAALPRTVAGIDTVEWLVVDDCSQDRTVEVARSHGADHVVTLLCHQGLAKCFVAALETSLALGADIIVNTDADNQYCADDIPTLVAPIMAGKAELVIGVRPIAKMEEFSRRKKWLQRLGSLVIRVVSNTDVPDATSGFRAMSRDAAMQVHVFSQYTYTLETIIQAGQKGMAVASVPIRVNNTMRRSRLVQNIPDYVIRQLLTIFRIFITYRPFRFFAVPGAVLFGAGALVGLRFVYLFFTTGGAGHIQSLILAALLISIGFFLGVVGILADLIAVNRQLLETLDWRMQKAERGFTSEKRAG